MEVEATYGWQRLCMTRHVLCCYLLSRVTLLIALCICMVTQSLFFVTTYQNVKRHNMMSSMGLDCTTYQLCGITREPLVKRMCLVAKVIKMNKEPYHRVRQCLQSSSLSDYLEAKKKHGHYPHSGTWSHSRESRELGSQCPHIKICRALGAWVRRRKRAEGNNDESAKEACCYLSSNGSAPQVAQDAKV